MKKIILTIFFVFGLMTVLPKISAENLNTVKNVSENGILLEDNEKEFFIEFSQYSFKAVESENGGILCFVLIPNIQSEKNVLISLHDQNGFLFNSNFDNEIFVKVIFPEESRFTDLKGFVSSEKYRNYLQNAERISFTNSLYSIYYEMAFYDINNRVFKQQRFPSYLDTELCAKLTMSDITLDHYVSREVSITGGDYKYDDDIINLIPRRCFTEIGTYSFLGQEYGFIVTTEQADSWNARYLTRVVLINVENKIVDSGNLEQVITDLQVMWEKIFLTFQIGWGGISYNYWQAQGFNPNAENVILFHSTGPYTSPIVNLGSDFKLESPSSLINENNISRVSQDLVIPIQAIKDEINREFEAKFAVFVLDLLISDTILGKVMTAINGVQALIEDIQTVKSLFENQQLNDANILPLERTPMTSADLRFEKNLDSVSSVDTTIKETYWVPLFNYGNLFSQYNLKVNECLYRITYELKRVNTKQSKTSTLIFGGVKIGSQIINFSGNIKNYFSRGIYDSSLMESVELFSGYNSNSGYYKNYKINITSDFNEPNIFQLKSFNSNKNWIKIFKNENCVNSSNDTIGKTTTLIHRFTTGEYIIQIGSEIFNDALTFSTGERITSLPYNVYQSFDYNSNFSYRIYKISNSYSNLSFLTIATSSNNFVDPYIEVYTRDGALYKYNDDGYEVDDSEENYNARLWNEVFMEGSYYIKVYPKTSRDYGSISIISSFERRWI